MTNKKKIAVIGSGPAGLTAGIYAARAGLDTAIFMGDQPGGQLTTTTDIENFPGAWSPDIKTGLQGPVLMDSMQRQAEHFGAKIVPEHIQKLELQQQPSKKSRFQLTNRYDESYDFDSVIIATGASAKYLGLENEEKWIGRGYHTCATCDGFFYKNKEIAVVGGGDSAMEEAAYLSSLASKVYLIHRSDVFRASPIMLERAKNNPKIHFLTHKAVESFLIDEHNQFAGALLRDIPSGEKTKLTVEALFVAIGHIPNSGFQGAQLSIDDAGYLLTREKLLPSKLSAGQIVSSEWAKFGTMTETEGIFIAGDVTDKTYRQAITAAGEGCRAAIDAQRWLEEN